ncbi:integrase, catalytic region, zinc finger, CCHC-type containing protein [Tanacetum coccineum]
MHNNIMAAGSKDRPPMLGPGRYLQWRSRFLRYIDTKPNGEGLRKSILSGPYVPSTVLVQAVAATEGNPAIQQHTTIETVLNMTPENKEHFLSEKEAIFLLLTGIGDDIYSTVEAYNYYQAPKPQRSNATSSSTRPSASTRHKGKEIAKPVTPQSESVSEEDSDPEQGQLNQRTMTVAGTRETEDSPVVQQTVIQCFNCKGFGHYAKECRKPKQVKDYTYHKEKMMMCKQVEQGVPLQAEQADWLVDMDEDIDEQELEAHYSFMKKIQEVLPEESSSTEQPLEQVQNNDENNVFANERQNSENNTAECADERAALANLIANLTLDTEENKTILKQLKKANASLTQELEECKTNLDETSRALGEAIVVKIVVLLHFRTNRMSLRMLRYLLIGGKARVSDLCVSLCVEVRLSVTQGWGQDYIWAGFGVGSDRCA